MTGIVLLNLYFAVFNKTRMFWLIYREIFLLKAWIDVES